MVEIFEGLEEWRSTQRTRHRLPKDNGAGVRPLGIPTVSDRIAQMVVKQYLEPKVEAHFHNDSHGYRPGRSAHEALYVARSRC